MCAKHRKSGIQLLSNTVDHWRLSETRDELPQTRSIYIDIAENGNAIESGAHTHKRGGGPQSRGSTASRASSFALDSHGAGSTRFGRRGDQFCFRGTVLVAAITKGRPWNINALDARIRCAHIAPPIRTSGRGQQKSGPQVIAARFPHVSLFRRATPTAPPWRAIPFSNNSHAGGRKTSVAENCGPRT
jgi:hypothetical protein